MFASGYDYRSSMSSALFWYLYSGGNLVSAPDDKGALEHRRWNVFMLTEGYAYYYNHIKNGEAQKKYDEAKLHANILPYSEKNLGSEKAALDTRISQVMSAGGKENQTDAPPQNKTS